MNVLLVGNGAREHIIAEKIAEESTLLALMSKKNPGIAKLCKDYYVCDITNPKEVKAWASGKNIDLVFVSPDAVLAAGISDVFEELGIKVASPLKDVADIECNKEFARELMQDHSIPGIVEYEIVENKESASKFIKDMNNQVAVKPIGLTGGKGVRVFGDHFQNFDEVMEYASELIEKDGKALIEEKLEGEEITLQAFSDGSTLAFMPPVQDHKRAFEGDKGPNTGGMGSYSTGELLPFMHNSELEKMELTMKKTIEALKKERTEFKGVLYGQFMLTKNGPKIIEYNARFGDPEAMNVLSLIETPLSEVLMKIAEGNLVKVDFEKKSTVVKYLVPQGYPEKPVNDSVVSIDYERLGKGAKVYCASVYEKDNEIFTTKSRTFGIVAKHEEVQQAEKIAEESVKAVSGPVWHRTDIGTSALLEKRIEHMKKIRG